MFDALANGVFDGESDTDIDAVLVVELVGVLELLRDFEGVFDGVFDGDGDGRNGFAT